MEFKVKLRNSYKLLFKQSYKVKYLQRVKINIFGLSLVVSKRVYNQNCFDRNLWDDGLGIIGGIFFFREQELYLSGFRFN